MILMVSLSLTLMDIPRKLVIHSKAVIRRAVSIEKRLRHTSGIFIYKKARHEYKFIGLRAHFILRAIREIETRFPIKFNNSKRFEYEIWRSSPLKKLTRQLRAINSLSALSSQDYLNILISCWRCNASLSVQSRLVLPPSTTNYFCWII